MKPQHISGILLSGLLSIGIAACAAPAAQTNPTSAAEAEPTAVTVSFTATPITDLAATVAAQPTVGLSSAGIIAEGEITPAQDASLLFGVNGTVGQVFVQEGDQVTQGQVLAILDTRSLDLQITQAEVTLAGAQSQLAALDEKPRAASVASAQAQLASAQTALAELKAGPKPADLASAQAALAQSQITLQTQRNSLSAAKSQAQSGVEQAANALRSAQDQYSQIYWQNRELEKLPGDLPQSYVDNEAAAQRAVQNAEETLRQAQLSLENAQNAEITGIQAAEQVVVQQQAALDKLLLPPTADRIAAAEAQVAAARASLDTLTKPVTAAQRSQAQTSVEQAQRSLEAAQLSRSMAELTAPFAGIVAEVNIDAGDPSSASGSAAIRLIDPSELYAEVAVSDIDIAQVSVGQEVSLTVQSLPDTTFTGSVVYIAPVATVTGNVRSFNVRISIDDQGGLLAGMRVRSVIAPE